MVVREKALQLEGRRYASEAAAENERSSRHAVRRSGPGLGAIELQLAELDAPDLAGEGLRQVGHELDQARVRIRREPLADEDA